MPGTQHGHQTRRSGARRPRPERPAAEQVPLDRVVACTTVDALRAAIVRTGSTPARSAAEAEGLALAGRPAAAIVGPDAAPSSIAAVQAPWVEHRIAAAAPNDAGHAFVLTAGDPQEAVDHVTIARLLAERGRRPVLCVVPPSVATRLAAVVLPGESTAGVGNGVDGDSTALDAAERAFADGSRLLGHAVAPVRLTRREAAQIAVVAAGAAATDVEDAVEMLQAAGVPATTLRIGLRRPFPAAWLAAELDGLSDVVIVGETGTREADVLAGEFAAVDTSARVHSVSIATCDRAAALARAVTLTLGLEVEPTTETPTRAPVVAVYPASGVGRDLLLAAVAPLAATHALPLAIVDDWTWAGAIALGAGATDAIDVLVVADARLLAGTRELASVRNGGVLLMLGVDATLDEHQTELARANGVHVLATDVDDASRLRGAIVAALARAQAGPSPDPLADVAAFTTADDLAPWREGAASVVDAAARVASERPTAGAPLLPAGDAGTAADDAAVRRFHMTGAGLDDRHAAAALLPLMPLALGTLPSEPAFDTSSFPLVLFDADREPQSVAAWVRDACADLDLLRPHVARLTGLVERALGHAGACAPFGAILDLAGESLRRSVDISAAGAGVLDAELIRVRGTVPDGALVFPAAAGAVRALHRQFAARDRRRRSTAARDEARRLARRLDEILAVDAGHRPADAASLSSSLGGAGGLLDVDALSRTLPKPHGPQDLSPDRRRRFEEARATLLRFAGDERPVVIAVVPAVLADVPVPDGVRVVTHEDPLRASIGLADGAAAALLPAVRALRLARLAARGEYDPERHDEILDGLDTDGLTDDEIRLAPAIVVEIGGDHVRRPAELGGLSELLRSGRPVQVVIEDRIGDALAGDAAVGHRVGHADLGSLAVAHRAAFVARSTLGRAEHVAAALRRTAESLLPAVAIVAVPEPGSVVPAALQLAAALYGRATPCFVHDPTAGASWAERFSIDGNPSPGLAWPAVTVAVGDGDQAEQRTESFTFAHAAALDTATRPDFRELAAEQWSELHTEIAEWLGPARDARRGRVPFVWTVGADRVVRRAVMTRELAAATADRLQAWHILQELAGTDNEYARRAAELARSRALDEALHEREALDARWQARFEDARREGAVDAVDRIVRVLLDPDAAAAAPALPTAPPAPPTVTEPRPNDPLAMVAPNANTAPAQESAAAEAPADDEDDDVSFDEAYIDSALCTTCNECTNLNSKLFVYNGNRQAEIGDIAAGTYDQLVRAAERCPAKCIHPGAPREGDSTATDQLVARAAPFR